MDLAALTIFRAVVRENGVTRAAAKLNRVQSNVTTRIKQLEEQLGTELFIRDGRRLVLTPAGETLLPYAERLLALADEARHAVREDRPSGRLRLGRSRLGRLRLGCLRQLGRLRLGRPGLRRPRQRGHSRRWGRPPAQFARRRAGWCRRRRRARREPPSRLLRVGIR